MKGHVCLFKLFGGCLRFLRKSNGGDPEPSIFRWSHPAEDEQHSHVETPLGLDPSSLDDLARGVDGLHVALKFRGLLPGLSVPIGFADRDNVLLIFEHGPREGESGSRSRTRFHLGRSIPIQVLECISSPHPSTTSWVCCVKKPNSSPRRFVVS